MIDFVLAYWGWAVPAVVVAAAALSRLFEYIEKRIERHDWVRDLVLRWLVVVSFHDSYREWLGRQLDGLDRWMGGLWSGQALARCLSIAFAYPVVLLLVGYGFGGRGTVGSTEFLPALQGWQRPALALGLLVLMVGIGLLFAFSEQIDEHLEGRVRAMLIRRGVANPEQRARWLYRLVGAAAAASLWLAAAFFLGVSWIVALALALALAGAVAGAGALALALAGAVAGAGAGAVAGAVAVAVAVMWLTGVNPLSLSFVLFFVLLPMANALLDWPSWAISRWLGRDLHDLLKGEPRRLGRWLLAVFGKRWAWPAFVLHVGLDLLAAVVLLAVLATLLPFLVELFNVAVAWSGGQVPLALHGFLTRAAQYPWPDGIWAFAMLLTTLFPTAVHTGAAILTFVVWLLRPLPWRRRLAEGLSSEDEGVRADAAVSASWLVVLTPLVIGFVVFGIGYGLAWVIGLAFGPVSQLLLDAALFGMACADHLAHALGLLPLG